jgi:hypothetical protein
MSLTEKFKCRNIKENKYKMPTSKDKRHEADSGGKPAVLAVAGSEARSRVFLQFLALAWRAFGRVKGVAKGKKGQD